MRRIDLINYFSFFYLNTFDLLSVQMKQSNPFKHARMFDYIWGDKALNEDFYIQIAENFKGPILECGSGTGLLLFAMARMGFDTYGIEKNQSMIDITLEKLKKHNNGIKNKIHTLHNNLLNLNIENVFGAAILANKTFNLFLDYKSQLRLLQNIHSGLKDNGRLLMVVYNPASVFQERGEPIILMEKFIPSLNRHIVVKTSYKYDFSKFLLCQNLYFEFQDTGEEIKRMENIKQKIVKKSEFNRLFKKIGFKVERFFDKIKEVEIGCIPHHIAYLLSKD